jgi:TonB family protein
MNTHHRKLAILIIFFCLFGPFTVLNAQTGLDKKISLNADRQNLRHVLNDIHDSTGVLFVYDDAHVRGKKVTASFKDIQLGEALDRILRPEGLRWAFDNNLIALYPKEEVSLGYRTERKKPAYKMPTQITPIITEYPRLAQYKGFEGTVIMHILVDRHGDVEDVKVAESSGYHILDNAAITSAENLKFNPAKQGSIPVPVWMEQKVTFDLTNRQVFQMEPFNTIEALRSELELDPTSVEKHTRLLDAYLYGIRYLMAQNNFYFNKMLKQFLEFDMFYIWDDYRNDVPLYFLLMHDYISLYPNFALS